MAPFSGPERSESGGQRRFDPGAFAQIAADQRERERPALLRAARLQVGDHRLSAAQDGPRS